MTPEEIQTQHCKNLISAVMYEAIVDYKKDVYRKGAKKALKLPPGRWLMDNDPRPFGMVWICDALGIDPFQVRLNIVRQ